MCVTRSRDDLTFVVTLLQNGQTVYASHCLGPSKIHADVCCLRNKRPNQVHHIKIFYYHELILLTCGITDSVTVGESRGCP